MAEDVTELDRRRRVQTLGWGRVAFFLVLLALITIGIALWSDREWDSAELHELLSQEPFDEAVVSEPFDFREVHAAGLSGDRPLLVYATFSGPPDRSRVSYQVFESEEQALEHLERARKGAAAGVEAEVVETNEVVDGAFCLQIATPLTECYAVIDEVVVRGDVWIDGGSGERAIAWARDLLRAGIDHLKSVV